MGQLIQKHFTENKMLVPTLFFDQIYQMKIDILNLI